MIHGIQAGAGTDIGLLRENNEDNFLMIDGPSADCDTRRFGYLFVVADGMGGHADGEVASRKACESMRRYYHLSGSQDPVRSHVAPESALRLLERVIHEANDSIYRFAKENRIYRGMGTTVSALVLLDEVALIGHVGDSRIYRLRDSSLEQMTVDHTEVQSMVEKGYLSEEAAAKHPFRHVLHQAVGVSENLDSVYTRMEKVIPGDIYLLSSDGLHEMINDFKIKELLLGSRDTRTACRRLIRQALQSGGRDNVTVLVVRILTEPFSEHE